jgi:hypothetical protein
MAHKELPQTDLTLNNGSVARFSYEDDWNRNVYEIDWKDKTIDVVDVDGVLHSMTQDGEPNCPLKVELQPLEA